MSKLTIPNSEKENLIIKSLREENAALKLEILALKKELPTDESTRKKAISGFIHKTKKLNESA